VVGKGRGSPFRAQDEVGSEWLVRAGSGWEYRPGDYLERPLRPREPRPERGSLHPPRPQEWSSDARSELRQQLASISGRFTVDHLGRYRAENVNKIRVFSPITA
jgi:type I restriction enzyme, R subunit